MMIRNFISAPSTREVTHAGKGRVRNSLVYGGSDFSTDLRFVIYSELKPGTSIGYHTHENNEEVYVILNKPYWSHGLENHSNSDLKVLVFEVQT